MLKQITLGVALLSGLLVGTAWGDDSLNQEMFTAIKAADKTKVEALLTKGADIHAKDEYGYTPLHTAAQRGYINIVELLVSKGADLNAKDNNGHTPLYYAKDPDADPLKAENHKAIAEILIAHGAH